MSVKLCQHQQWHLDCIWSSRKATSWASNLINETWDLVFQMWDHRNKINNGTTAQQEKIELKGLCRQVKREFRKGTKGLLAADHHMLQDKFKVLSQDLPELCQSLAQLTQSYLKPHSATRATGAYHENDTVSENPNP